MWTRLSLILLALVLSSNAAWAQTLIGDRLYLKGGQCYESSGSAAPNGAVTGNPCDTYKETTTDKMWWKITGAGTNTGWITWDSANTASYFVQRDGSGYIHATTAVLSALTSGRVPFATTAGQLTDDGDLTFATDTLTATKAITPSWLQTPKVYGYGADNGLVLGGIGGTCLGYPSCEANVITIDASLLTQRMRTDTAKQTQWYVSPNAAYLNSFNGSGWAPLVLSGGPVRVGGGGFQIGSDEIVDPGLGNAAVDGYIGDPDYASQTIGWRIDGLGAADFRYLYTDELHARKFIADLEQALAGLQIIAKSVGQLGAEFTVPAPGSISTLTMKDLPSANNMAIFEAGDYIWIRQFSRAGGTLSITNAYGTVTGYTDLADGLQSWQFTRLISNGGAMTTGAVIEVDSIILDLGVPGNGWVETNSVDGLYGVNSPYTQIVTWAGDSPISGNQTIRVRMGNLRGILGASEYGLIAGTYAATNGRYFVATDQRFELHGIDLSLWSGATKVISLDRTTPYMSMGSPAPTTYASGTGCWSGLDGGVFKWRCGNPSGHYIDWNGTQLTVNGNIVVSGTSIDAATVNGVSGATVVSGAQRALLGLTSGGNPALPAVATPSGSGLFLGSDYMGYYTGGAWKTFMNSSGQFYLGGTAGALQWNGTTLTIAATLSGNGSGITSITGGNITTDSITATQIAADAITTSELAANSVTSAEIVAGTIVAADIAAGTITGTQIAAGTISATEIMAATITGAKIAAGTITASNISAGTITGSQIAAGTITADLLSVTSLSAITANLGTVTAGSIEVGSGDRLYLNTSSFHVFGIGGSGGVDSAPFRVTWSGVLTVPDLVVSNAALVDELTVDTRTRMVPFQGGGATQFVCSDNSGDLYSSGSTCDGSAERAYADVAALRLELAELRALVAALLPAFKQ